MIANLIIQMITFLIQAVVSILPVATLPEWISGGISGLAQYFIDWNFIFPIANFLLLVAFFITVELTILAIYGINAIIKVVRGSG